MGPLQPAPPKIGHSPGLLGRFHPAKCPVDREYNQYSQKFKAFAVVAARKVLACLESGHSSQATEDAVFSPQFHLIPESHQHGTGRWHNARLQPRYGSRVQRACQASQVLAWIRVQGRWVRLSGLAVGAVTWLAWVGFTGSIRERWGVLAPIFFSGSANGMQHPGR